MGTDRRILSEVLVCEQQSYVFLGLEKRQLHAALLLATDDQVLGALRQ